MNDIEKMKQDFEQKLKYALMENELEGMLNFEDVEIRILGIIYSVKDKLHVRVYHKNGFGSISNQLASRVLKTFLPTEKIKVSCEEETALNYSIIAESNYKGDNTLNISYISGDYNFRFSMPIDGNEILEQFFIRQQRPITSSEAKTYLGGATKRKINITRVVEHMFNKGSVHKYSDCVVSTDENVVNEIIETIKNVEQ